MGWPATALLFPFIATPASCGFASTLACCELPTRQVVTMHEKRWTLQQRRRRRCDGARLQRSRGRGEMTTRERLSHARRRSERHGAAPRAAAAARWLCRMACAVTLSGGVRDHRGRSRVRRTCTQDSGVRYRRRGRKWRRLTDQSSSDKSQEVPA
jgi:hypothetical protein